MWFVVIVEYAHLLYYLKMAGDFIIATSNSLVFNLVATAPFWIALGLAYVLFHAWVYYARAKFFFNKEYILLEVKLPEEIFKTPLAMELVLNVLHQTSGESTWYDRRILGKTRAYFSLEMVSLEGDVKFFIRTDKFLQPIIENQIYSQYPTAEIFEVPDYTAYVPYRIPYSKKRNEEWSLWGTEFVLTKPDPYPIKTYIDYGLDKPVREEIEKNDPLTPLIEYLGSMGRGEQAWYQILVRANKDKDEKTSFWDRDWRGEAEKTIDEIMAKYKYTPQREGEEAPDDDSSSGSLMSPGDKEVVESIHRAMGKLGFDCGIRGMYLATEERFRPQNIPGLINALKQFSSPNLNGFKPNSKTLTDKDFPWQDYKDIRINRRKIRLFDAYRRRSYFFPPYERKPFVLTSEELATIYHFPGGVAQTPTFGRIGSRKAEPPTNLPIGGE